MNNPFSISDDKLKVLLKSYSEWIKNAPKKEDKNYADVQKQLTKYLKETLLNKKYLGEISKDQLAKEIFAYSRKLEGPVFIRLGRPRITNNTEKIRNILLYLIGSPDDPIKKASGILSGKYRISIFSKAFWSPIFQAQFPEILPNWNNKTERFLKIIGIDLKTTKRTIEEKYRLLSNAFVYLAQLDPDQDFYTLNHLMHYGTEVEEGKEQVAKLLGSGALYLDSYKDKGFTKGENSWIFQANPKRFNILEELRSSKNIQWATNQDRERIHIGDKIYIWKSGKNAGIYGIGHTLNLPYKSKNEFGEYHVDVAVDRVFLLPIEGGGLNPYITREMFLENPILERSKIILQPQSTNFLLTKEEAIEIEKIVANNSRVISYWRIIEPLDTHDYSVWPGCKENNLIAIGYRNKKDDPNIRKLREKIKKGDQVIAYILKGRIGGIGTVVGDYEDYNETRPKEKDYFNGRFWRFRKVKWDYLPTGQDYWQIPQTYSKKILNTLGQRQTIFQLKEEQFNEIMSLIGISGDLTTSIENGKISTYSITKEKILKEIFLEEEKFDQVVNLLENSNKKQIILQGSPGTGKTFIAQRIALFLAQSKDRVETIQFHPSYSYEDFIEGYRPTRDKGFELEEGIFKQFCLKARSDPQNKYVLIIDEINRGNLAKIFGELLYLLEYRQEKVKLTYSKELFSIPENIYIIGTMNTADRSLAIMDYALRRRFYFLNLNCQTKRLANWLKENGCKCDIEDLINRLGELNRKISEEMRSSDFAIGHSYFMKENLNNQALKNIITFEVKPLLEEYFYDRHEKALELIKILGDYAE